ncbi:ABC transporter ATP-binding protein [Rhodococcus rhodnii]|uniref:ABC transporter ATP-binding protein n=2 Tax=Rhodococcus rhodnii TaxID=38312 RepID=A0A6P2CI36_9NOCA|nr:ABC-F family ATP-binding cassette domain-containing protein [Rhodococcus rhodnii]TXG92449.1 ABC transporter ATP-binding protein [Rhodococcus rhodnii]
MHPAPSVSATTVSAPTVSARTASPSQLVLDGVTLRYPDRVVLRDVSFSVTPGETVGVIGENGAGKSTLLGLIAGAIRPGSGDVRVVAPGGIAHAAQSLELPPGSTVQDAIDHVLADLRALERRLRSLEEQIAASAPTDLDLLLCEYRAATDELDARDGYTADRRVAEGLAALGLPGLDLSSGFATLSGGERARVALAAALASHAELLLLDEPTNDLDDDAVHWLERRLAGHTGTVLAVTHDREFLARLTSVVLEVAEGSVRRYGDGYDGYLAAKATERRRRLQQYEDWRAELERSATLVESNAARLDAIPRKAPKSGFGHGAFRARGRDHGARSRIANAKERLERLTSDPVAPPPDPLRFTPSFDGRDLPSTSGDGAVRVCGLRVGGRLTLDAFDVPRDGRVVVTGRNGAGKTTLLDVLAGEVEPDAGDVHVRGRVAYLRQHVLPSASGRTLAEAFAARAELHLDDARPTLLALGLFEDRGLDRPETSLSYGQRRRLDLAVVVTSGADLLLFDEPTNHLSPAVIEDLEAALDVFPGAVVIVTHDRRMRARLRGKHVALVSALTRGVG